MIKIGIIGTGSVGLVTGVCLSDFGWQVVCTDRDEEIVASLNCGKPTIIYEAARLIVQKMEAYKVVVNKSTVPIGFDVVSNPEFLRQGSAIQDFTHADRVVIGAESQKAIDIMKEVYRVLYINETPFLIVNIETAKIRSEMGDLKGKLFGVLGLLFKNNTDDMKEAPSLSILKELAAYGAAFKVYDPKARGKAEAYFLEYKIEIIKYCHDEYDVSEEADAVILLTEWNQFRSLDLDRIKSEMSGNYFFDFRNIYASDLMTEKGFQYFSVGRTSSGGV